MTLTTKRVITIGDVLKTLEGVEIDFTSLEYLTNMLEKEWYLLEERFGGAHSISSELHGFLDYIKRSVIPQVAMYDNTKTSDELRKFIDSYVENKISLETRDHILLHASPFTIRTELKQLA